jgi:hypothetical protein
LYSTALVEPVVSTMAPKFARTIIKRHLTRIINLVETYKSTEMTLEAFIEVEKLEEKLDGFYKTYEIFSKRIQAEIYKEGEDLEEFNADITTRYQTKSFHIY